MLQKLGDHIAECLARAAEAEHRAAEATDQSVRADNRRLAQTWRHLAASYQFVESLERFLVDADKARTAQLPKPPEPPPILPLIDATFDPEAVAILSAAYAKAIEGQPHYACEGIAKHIIELASEGERDRERLCNGALALCMLNPRSRP